MKYQDILPDVLAGKWVRIEQERSWIRMKSNGDWIDDKGDEVRVHLCYYKIDTWEVKSDEPEEIFVWGTFFDISKLLPADKLHKYKLIPVDEEPGTYRYKYSIQTEEKSDVRQVLEELAAESLSKGEYKMWKKFYQRLGKVSYFPDSNSFLKQIKKIIDDLSPIQ